MTTILETKYGETGGKVNGVKSDSKILFMSDTKSFFSKNHGWDAGMGDRNGRWAMIIEQDGTVSAADVEKSPREVTVSGPRTNMLRTLTLTWWPGLWCRRYSIEVIVGFGACKADCVTKKRYTASI